MTSIICGVDVSSNKLDARIGRQGASLRVDRTAEGIGQLATFCQDQGVGLLVMEATGGYEKLPFAMLWAAGIRCAVVNPRSVRHFAEAMGILEKTDLIDPGVIAWYAQAKDIVPHAPHSQSQQRLRALVTRLAQLTTVAVMQGNQRRLIDDPTACASIDELMGLVRRQMRYFEHEIAALLDTDPLWRALDQAFRAIKGVADRTVARLMAELPEIGTISNKAVGKIVGLAPLAPDSGKINGRRRIRGGRSGLRALLVTVAEIVRRWDPDFADFHKRLKDAGKPPMVVRIALARKLLVRLNSKARDVRAQLALTA